MGATSSGSLCVCLCALVFFLLLTLLVSFSLSPLSLLSAAFGCVVHSASYDKSIKEIEEEIEALRARGGESAAADDLRTQAGGVGMNAVITQTKGLDQTKRERDTSYNTSTPPRRCRKRDTTTQTYVTNITSCLCVSKPYHR